jgi:ribonuclease HI
MSPLTLPTNSVGELEALAEQLRLPDHDLLLVGDGSGSIFTQPAGWACIAYDRLGGKAVVHAGGLTTGTNNFAELAPYIQALWFHNQEHSKPPKRAFEVAIMSDSEVTVRCGNRQYARNANGCLWSSIEWFERNGYALSWVHVRRNSNPWNAWADQIAGYFRCSIEVESQRVCEQR